MRLLALDQSSKITGWAVFEDSKLISSGIFSVKSDDLGERLLGLRNFIHKTVIDQNIDEVIMEDIQLQDNVGNNVQTFKILAEVFGVIYELLTELNIPNQSVLAVVWKHKLQISGKQRREQKRAAQTYVKSLYSKEVSEDESDAICIGTYYYKMKEPNKKSDFDWSE